MSLLTDLQQEAAAQLVAQAFFSDAGNPAPRPVAVLTEQIGSLPARIAQSLGQLGIVCVLLTPTARTTHLHYPRPYFDEIQIIARTQENVLLNRSATGTGQPASLVAESVAWFLHGFAPDRLGCTLRLAEIRLVADPRLLIYETVFTLQAGLSAPPARAAPSDPVTRARAILLPSCKSSSAIFPSPPAATPLPRTSASMAGGRCRPPLSCAPPTRASSRGASA